MRDDAAIREALERNVALIARRPTIARGTATTRAVLRPGLDCTITDGAHVLHVGMTEKYGGNGGSPNPGVLGRAALASCLAIGYGMWASRLEVPCEAVEVEVQADYDVRGELGVAPDVRPAYLEIRYVVRVVTSAPEEVVRQMLDIADRFSAYRDMFANGVSLVRELRIEQPEV